MKMIVYSLALSSLLVAGCSAQVTDSLDKESGAVAQDDIGGLKVSPLSGTAQGSTVSASFKMTPSKKSAEGSTVGVSFSFHRNQPQ